MNGKNIVIEHITIDRTAILALVAWIAFVNEPISIEQIQTICEGVINGTN